MTLPNRIILIGPSGSGKTTIAERLGALTGYRVVDTDAAIVERCNMPIAEFFERFGEPAFRAIETEELRRACAQPGSIVATGGGVVLSSANWTAMRPDSVIVGVTARLETLVSRVVEHARRAGPSAERPLLAGDAGARLTRMLDSRAPLYAQADVTIHTDDLSPDEVASQALRACVERHARGLAPRLSFSSATERSDIYVSRGARLNAATLIQERWPRALCAWIVSDTSVDRAWGDELAESLDTHSLTVNRLIVNPGERSKSMAEVERLCREMTDGGVTRRDVVIALGGGVVGDLAGFVASVCLRGLALAQIPTSLLAMADSSVGGKTGVNLPAGKNLAGAFYQPGIVLIDPTYLSTLPRDEYRSGMAEVIKHSVIQPSTPLGDTTLGELLVAGALDPIPEEAIETALALNVAIKHSVVQQDERESGLRMILNLGHTTGHAIEAAGYRYRHGEAIAIGMAVAFRIAWKLGLVGGADVDAVESLLRKAGLPTRFTGDVDDIVGRLARDKKMVDGSLHWILPRPQGGVQIVTGVSPAIVEGVIQDVQIGDDTAGDGAAVL
ncbi:MAG TPA: 3-dehydroquinate synthase [Thermomicrobiales bacterium]|nr:3-dehydroquinate synthase [Thermomicrobiales bacterium]